MGREAGPVRQGVALEEVQEGQQAVEVVVAGEVVLGELADVGSDGEQKPVKVKGFVAWSLM